MNALPPTQPTTKSGIDAGLAFHQPMLASPEPQAMLPSERIAATMGDRNLTPKQFGALGEQYAAAWLEEHGWTTLSRNWPLRRRNSTISGKPPAIGYLTGVIGCRIRRSVSMSSPSCFGWAGRSCITLKMPSEAPPKKNSHVAKHIVKGVDMAIGSTLSVGLIGLKAFIVQVQAFISPGLPYFSIIGLPDASLSEARERVKSACQATGFGWPQTRVTVNMSPAAMPKRGS